MGAICSKCQGTGKVLENGLCEDGKCSKCQGTGKVLENGLFGLEVHTCLICLGKGY